MIIMAILKKKDLKEMNEKQVDEKLRELRLELTKERGSIEVGGSVKNPGKVREIRKTIAKILTKKNNTKKVTKIKKEVQNK